MTSAAVRPLATSIVGSYPQPGWLVDRAHLAGTGPARARDPQLWRPDADTIAEAQDDATAIAIDAQERAGLDIVTDGEARRESYSNHFATALDGIDVDDPGTRVGRNGRSQRVPRIVGPVTRPHSIEARDTAFLRARTDRLAKITMPGPFTMSQNAQDDFYGDEEALAFALADACHDEMLDLFAAGADIVQIDEPYMQAVPDAARAYGLAALNHALRDAPGTTAVHLCFGYAAKMPGQKPSGYSFLPELAGCVCDHVSIESAQPDIDLGVLADLSGKTVALGVIDLSTDDVEAPEVVADRVRRALRHHRPEKLVLSTDCGMKYLTRAAADGKMAAMVAAAAVLRDEVGAG
ncbi:5-methyltetrahydropteroyltriglutamate--homocysteine methyltransferase [Pseudonocardia sediminis]|uniref:5-methyltetrahydropteroyltriglutamate--homocysteine methyltransferase n=1 Tax=Pseudonocardia sediminis TaxID=1397368 RepID=A0A4V2FQH6_PSEST|nr:uroporphyrinogen decarboxylase family protein [Pseudonocardia sediminis]RZT84230.1 5-methyltetrahydropteroyltriglutamate--homocysteine methyltransferase [Pseudonocardia sediminis]